MNKHLEAFLFWKGEPVEYTELLRVLDIDQVTLEQSLTELTTTLTGRGITLVRTATTAELRTSPDTQDLISRCIQASYKESLSKAALETLTIILYQGPIGRKHIDYIRGVNSQVMIRTLIGRGLIERVDSTDHKGYVYQATTDLLSHLGIANVEALPGYAEYKTHIEHDIASADIHG